MVKSIGTNEKEGGDTLKSSEQAAETLHLLRRCGHYLHHHWGCGRASQMRALHILEDCGEMTQRELQDRMGIQQGSLSELVKKLDEQSFITRTCSPTDRRQLLIRITEPGRQQSQLLRERRNREAMELAGALSEEEQQELRVLLSKLLNSWQGHLESRGETR